MYMYYCSIYLVSMAGIVSGNGNRTLLKYLQRTVAHQGTLALDLAAKLARMELKIHKVTPQRQIQIAETLRTEMQAAKGETEESRSN